jgi:hypothetical protein
MHRNPWLPLKVSVPTRRRGRHRPSPGVGGQHHVVPVVGRIRPLSQPDRRRPGGERHAACTYDRAGRADRHRPSDPGSYHPHLRRTRSPPDAGHPEWHDAYQYVASSQTVWGKPWLSQRNQCFRDRLLGRANPHEKGIFRDLLAVMKTCLGASRETPERPSTRRYPRE